MAAKQASNLASPAEVAEAISRLSVADALRLKAIARLRASGLRAMDADDLLNEAKARAMSGKRHWPRDVPLVAFLAQTIRSIASEERQGFNEQKIVVDPDLGVPGGESGSSLPHAAAEDTDPERTALAQKTLEEIFALFDGDRHAIAILEGMAEDLTPVEIQTAGAMTAVEYASAQKRIRRAVLKTYLRKEERI